MSDWKHEARPASVDDGEAAGSRTAPEQRPDPAPSGPAVHTGVASGDVDYESPLLSCLSLLFSLLGKPVPVSAFASGLPRSTAGGVPPAVAVRAARREGASAKLAHRPDLGRISRLTLPCILLLNNANACVLTAVDDETAQVVLPEVGEKPVGMPLDALRKEYAGYAIFAKLPDGLDRRAHDLKLLKAKRWFWGTIAHFWPIYRHVCLSSVVINLLTIVMPLFFMNVYDRVVPNNATETLWVLAVGIVAAILFDFLLRNLRSYFVDTAGRNADVVLASRLMSHLMGIRMDNKPDSTGTMANNLREFESLREFFSSTTMLGLIDLPFLLLFVAIIGFIGGPLFWVPAMAVPAVILVGLLVQYPFQRVVEKGYKESAQKNALLIEILNGLETVKTSGGEGRLMHKWESVIGMNAASNARAKTLANFSITFSMVAAQLVSVTIIVWGVYRITEGQLTMGGLIACNILAGRSMAPLGAVAAMITRLQQSRMALKSLDFLMCLPTERVDGDAPFEYGALRRSIQFEDLTFKYPNTARNALEGVNLCIEEGDRVGVIGPMGSGKTTLGRLSVGLYQPQEGAVKVGDVDIRQMDVAVLRRNVGYVSQDNYLFYGTVRDNITLGMPGADDQAVYRAAFVAGAMDFVQAHPAGFGMPVGERGMGLSGGQRQSLAIARALLSDPKTLVLDEPTSNMDQAAEHLFKTRLAQTLGGKTLLLITHRMSMLDLVDKLAVIDGGRVVAFGPKAQVLADLREQKVRTAAALQRRMDG
ncbi:MAG: type I secretion system permease/ATPase [Desulfovibrionaceae bacterium]